MPPSHMPVNKTFAKNGLKPSDPKFINSSDLMTTPGAILQNKKTPNLKIAINEPKNLINIIKPPETARNLGTPKLSYDFSNKKKSLKNNISNT